MKCVQRGKKKSLLKSTSFLHKLPTINKQVYVSCIFTAGAAIVVEAFEEGLVLLRGNTLENESEYVRWKRKLSQPLLARFSRFPLDKSDQIFVWLSNIFNTNNDDKRYIDIRYLNRECSWVFEWKGRKREMVLRVFEILPFVLVWMNFRISFLSSSLLPTELWMLRVFGFYYIFN